MMVLLVRYTVILLCIKHSCISRFILDNVHLVKGKRVLDFGCGCGASGLAAKASKAKHVTFNDIDKGIA